MASAATFKNLSRKFFGRDFSEILPLLGVLGGTIAFGAYTWKNRVRDVHDPKENSGTNKIGKLGTREEKHSSE